VSNGFEGDNPTRRYKWFRPRQAAIGSTIITGGASYRGSELYNGSSTYYLVVRDALVWCGIGGIQAAFATGPQTDASGTAYQGPIVSDAAVIAGTLYAGSVAAGRLSPALFYYTQSLFEWTSHDFPLAVIGPNSSLVFQGAYGNSTAEIDHIMWEAIYPDELDYMFSL